ncbi:MAG: hypothetical protein QHJ73_15095, partial [Armatimonadota bacterium]|nr:hypothetical protein [Armatimonadota bacterium]
MHAARGRQKRAPHHPAGKGSGTGRPDWWRLAVAALLLLVGTATLCAPALPPIFVMTVDGVIDPPTANYLDRVLTRAETEGAGLVLMEMDTPGG